MTVCICVFLLSCPFCGVTKLWVFNPESSACSADAKALSYIPSFLSPFCHDLNTPDAVLVATYEFRTEIFQRTESLAIVPFLSLIFCPEEAPQCCSVLALESACPCFCGSLRYLRDILKTFFGYSDFLTEANQSVVSRKEMCQIYPFLAP